MTHYNSYSNNPFMAAPSNQSFSSTTVANQPTVSTLPYDMTHYNSYSNNQFAASPSSQSFSWATDTNQPTVSTLPFSFAPNTANYSPSFNNQFAAAPASQNIFANPNSFTQPFPSQPSSNNSFSYPPQNPSTSKPKTYCKQKSKKVKSINKKWDKSNLIRSSAQLFYKLIHLSGCVEKFSEYSQGSHLTPKR